MRVDALVVARAAIGLVAEHVAAFDVAEAIAGIGLAMMYSAGGDEGTVYLSQQFSRFAFAFVIMLVLAIMPMKILMDYAYVAYFLCLLILQLLL